MSDIDLPAAQSTPLVVARGAAGTLEMRGDSYPENSVEFFAPIVAWVQEVLAPDDASLRVELHLLYLNTSSVRAMMDIFDLLEEAHQAGKTIQVSWYYDGDNERIAELAEEFKEDCSFDFHIVRCESDIQTG